MAGIMRLNGDAFEFLGNFGFSPEYDAFMQAYTIPTGPGSIGGRTLLEAKPVQIADVLSDPEYKMKDAAKIGGQRTILGVPLLREGKPIGVIILQRKTVQPFNNKQIELITTFADQAVIAIENARLFEAEQLRTRELSESLERQTATSDVLSVISRSPTDLQSVFDAIAAKALDLCGAMTSAVCTFDGQLVHMAAMSSFHEEPAVRENWPRPPSWDFVTGRSSLSKASAYIPDVFEESEYPLSTFASVIGYRSILSVPMLRDDRPMGAITISAAQPRAFSPKLIALLQTFADQAVIAIENTRLFEAEQASKRELTEALQYQAATSEVLGIIGRSQTTTQPVFDIIAKSALRLAAAQFSTVVLYDGEMLRLAAYDNANPEGSEALRSAFPQPRNDRQTSGRALALRRAVQIPDVLEDLNYDYKELARALGFRSTLAVPMMRDSVPIGVIGVGRAEPGTFTNKQVELVQTFADQAVIAIENTRLFEEVQ